MEETKNTTNDESKEETDNKYEIYDSFDDMELKSNLLRGIYGYGFDKPSSIQQRAIIPFSKGRDIIAQSQSGTGKTATFSIGLLQKINLKLKSPQAIVLAPTRDLAKQIGKVLKELGKYMKELDITISIGGEFSKERYSERNKIKSQIVVGTPGRTYQYLRNNWIDRNNVKMIILDEADQMLSNDFKEQIFDILRTINKKDSSLQIGLYSATMPEEMLEFTKKFMIKPITILVKKDELTLDGIKQFYIALDKNDYKFDTICDLYKTISVTQCIIYCNTVANVERLHHKLNELEFTVSYLHGQMEQRDRNEVLEKFRSGSNRILITTDVLARGIDVQQVSLVINYDLPKNKETYIHRIGRSGRFGRKGTAINFVTLRDGHKLKEIEEFYSTQIEELPSNIGDLI